MYKFPPVGRHVREDLCSLLRGDEASKARLSAAVPFRVREATYSEKLFSTTPQNLALARAYATRSSGYTTSAFAPARSPALPGEIPSASARRALRFATAHSLEHLICAAPSRPAGLPVLLPHGDDCRILPHAQVSVIVAMHGSASEHEEGA